MKFLSLLVVACMAISSTVDAAGVLIKNKEGNAIPGKYIVMLKRDFAGANTFENRINNTIEHRINEISRRSLDDNILSTGRRRKTPKITHRFEALHGLTVEDADDHIHELVDLDDVEYIEQDAVYQIMATQANPPTYGLPRITQRNRLGDSRPGYKYPNQAGAGITAYIIDSGININHVDFGGRARLGANFIRGSPNFDDNGHGTHVAGTVGGTLYGVAKKVDLVSVKVLNREGRGMGSGFIAGMDWVVRDARGKRA
ncbi:hypothetical protein DFQ27_000326, partial [Actinomortierella ambigua]